MPKQKNPFRLQYKKRNPQGVFIPSERMHVTAIDNRMYQYSAWEQGYISFTDNKVAYSYAKLVSDRTVLTYIDPDLFFILYPDCYLWDSLE